MRIPHEIPDAVNMAARCSDVTPFDHRSWSDARGYLLPRALSPTTSPSTVQRHLSFLNTCNDGLDESAVLQKDAGGLSMLVGQREGQRALPL